MTSKKLIIFILLMGLITGSYLFFTQAPPTVSLSGRTTYKNIKAADPLGALENQTEHKKQLRAIDNAGEYIRSGNISAANGKYTEAIEYYEKAYEADPGSRTFITIKLINIYENLGLYDEAIAILDRRLANTTLSAYGIQQFTSIRSRLLAAKQAQNQSAS